MHRPSRYILSGALSLGATLVLCCSPALAAPTVTVRVVGESATLLASTPVALGTPDPEAPGCPADSANAALNSAIEYVGGTWDHGNAFPGGDFTETILEETHDFELTSTTWDVWIDDKWGGGICEDILSEGDELLLDADYEPGPAFAPTRFPLVIAQAPATVGVGKPFAVHVAVVQTAAGTFPEVGEGTTVPIEGAAVAAGSTSSTSNAQGEATLQLNIPGIYTLSASKAGEVPSAPVSICVLAAGASACGEFPGQQPAGSGSAPASSSLAIAQPYKGPFALVADVGDIVNGRIYRAAHAPRLIAGTILSHSAVNSVSLELRREYRGRCSSYDGTSERFVHARCGHGGTFAVSSSGTFSYLLPEHLRPGRYVLDVHATDVAGNVTTLARGTSRLVFYVR